MVSMSRSLSDSSPHYHLLQLWLDKNGVIWTDKIMTLPYCFISIISNASTKFLSKLLAHLHLGKLCLTKTVQICCAHLIIGNLSKWLILTLFQRWISFNFVATLVRRSRRDLSRADEDSIGSLKHTRNLTVVYIYLYSTEIPTVWLSAPPCYGMGLTRPSYFRAYADVSAHCMNHSNTAFFRRKAEVGTKSVIAITLRYVFSLSHNPSTLRRKVVASFSYRSGLREIVIASYVYRSRIKRIVIAYNSYRSKVTNRYSFL
jgi:hypothetical protein